MTANVKDRIAGIGGSDVAGILGRSPWTTPLQVYLEKVGAAEPLDETERMRWGTLLEEPVAREYALRTGGKVRRVNETLRHPEHRCLMAHIDRRVVGRGDGVRRILEVKTSDKFNRSDWGDDGTDQVPEPYLLQSMHYLGITGADVCDVAALIGGNELRIFHVHRDDQLIAYIVDECSRFWTEHVEMERPPDPMSMHEVTLRYREQVGGQLEASPETCKLIADLVHAQDAEKRIKAEIDRMRFDLAMAMRMPDDPDAIVGALIDEDFHELVTMKGHVRQQFSTKDFKDVHPDLYAEFCKEIEVRPLRVTKHGRALATQQDQKEEDDGRDQDQRAAS